MTRWVVLLAALAALVAAAPASAHLQHQQVKLVKSKLHKSKSVVRFYNGDGRWALHSRYRKCWQIESPKRERICRTARRNLAWHSARVKKLEARLRALSGPLPEIEVTADERAAFLCIRSYEARPEHGSWRANTGNGYYGGLQMDLDFQRTYGSRFMRAWGTANNWPVWAQIEAAVRAKRSGRGYYPWPNTARYCDLIS